MNRTTLSLIAAGAALASVTGFAALTAPDDTQDGGAKAAAQRPVERSSLLCPAPSTSELAETAYTSFTPKTSGASEGQGSAELQGAVSGKSDKSVEFEKSESVLESKAPGKPVTGEVSSAEAPALIGTAEGALAPGWTVQQTTQITAGGGRGLLGVTCSTPGTEFWFPGASTAKDRSDYVHLTNPDDSAAVADIELHGPEGAIKSETGEGIQIPPRSSVSVLLSTLTDSADVEEAQGDDDKDSDDAADVEDSGAESEKAVTNLTAHVTARSGRVGASVQASDDKLGADWLPASAEPAATVVLPGIPKDATEVRLVAFAPGDDDADLKVSLAGPNGAITPAGNETLHVKRGMTAAVDLGDVTKGEAGSLLLTPVDKESPVVAALRVTRGKGAKREVAFIPASGPVGDRATVADNRAKGSTLALVAPDKTAKVRVTASAGSEGGSSVTKTYEVKGGTTREIEPLVPDGLKGTYALTVEQLSGTVHASRTLELPEDGEDGVPMFTVQTLRDDRGTVGVPEAKQDLSVLGN
ncbi:DUF5719 family protein [Streptomyces sp. E11-3]|uniref:DUF5719 family protein n=1 Tax=Streptomyces sp. E11-3 TaxID=3110112 RepID=UPI0039815EAD